MTIVIGVCLERQYIRRTVRIRGDETMPIIKQTKFNIGDVVETRLGIKGIIYTTEKTEGLKRADSVFSEICAREYYREDVFGIEWFNDRQTDFLPEDDLMPCSGMTFTSLCERCESRFQCWTSRRKWSQEPL